MVTQNSERVTSNGSSKFENLHYTPVCDLEKIGRVLQYISVNVPGNSTYKLSPSNNRYIIDLGGFQTLSNVSSFVGPKCIMVLI